MVATLEQRIEMIIALYVICRPAGHRLPSERAIARQLECSRTTVRLVLGRLVARGDIVAWQGKGYFVAGRDEE